MASIAITQEAFKFDGTVALESPEQRFNELVST
jgi:hypothetical protein